MTSDEGGEENEETEEYICKLKNCGARVVGLRFNIYTSLCNSKWDTQCVYFFTPAQGWGWGLADFFYKSYGESWLGENKDIRNKDGGKKKKIRI